MVILCAGMSVEEALQLAIQGGAQNLGRDDIGKIASCYAADFIGWRTDSIGEPLFCPAHVLNVREARNPKLYPL